MHVLVVDGHVARVDVEVAVLRISSRVGGGEVEPLDRLGDEAVELRGPDLPGDGCDLGVDEACRVNRERGRRVDRHLGHGPRPEGRDPPRLDLCPDSGEAVPQLEGVADELLRSSGRDAEHGAELRDAELRD
ncbi:hypothetical protein, partial [Nocardioides sp. Soil774]|uniref:hypothetical protein n=1 Tax=Nocardioides sp. Soil774 TaxID=1736408 RepID=UPI001F31C89F